MIKPRPLKKMKFYATALFAASVLFTGCAASYQPIAPATVSYVSKSEKDGIELQYKYGLLNKRYTKKETKKGIKVVAVKITNHSDKDIQLGEDFQICYENGSNIQVLEKERVFIELKQSTPIYLLYLLLTPMTFEGGGSSQNGSSKPINIGYVIGPGLAGGNMIVAGAANQKFKAEMEEYNIIGTTIKKGESKYGLIGIRSDNFDALKLK